jgi:hypothetical protein
MMFRTVTVITIEGAEVKAKMIAEEKLLSIWKTLTRKPFPRIAAFQLDDTDFDYAIKLRKCRDDERREIEEWGRVLSAKGTDACVFNCEEFPDIDYVILVRENSYHDLEKVLEHELSHIARGDL